MVTEAIFITSMMILIYTYIGYPALVFVLSRLFRRDIRMANFTPRVSVIIAARNEEQNIAAKLANTLALEYPNDRMEIIVASDCSMDQTDAIVRSFADRGVILHRQSVRHGKTAAQNHAVHLCSGDILVFSDATTRLSPNAVKRIVRGFADPDVGCVAGQLVYADPEDSAVGHGCRSYWNWEKQIKQSESLLGSLIGVSGCFYAVRRTCYPRLSEDMIDDFVIGTEIYLQGLRTVYDPEALAMEYTHRHAIEEFRMRLRVIEQSMNALRRYRRLLSGNWNMFRFQLLSHKWLRYLAPCFLVTAYFSSLLLVNHGALYTASFVGMTLLYLSALAGWRMDRLHHRIGPLVFPYYFVLANVASMVALVKFLRGDSSKIWEPVRERIEPLLKL
jgi:cellulose synthase/poly-beta-1,6-N-acetylglucosamine synthase-like glycosyltransferase